MHTKSFLCIAVCYNPYKRIERRLPQNTTPIVHDVPKNLIPNEANPTWARKLQMDSNAVLRLAGSNAKLKLRTREGDEWTESTLHYGMCRLQSLSTLICI